MDRVVDIGAAWYAATMMFVAVFLATLALLVMAGLLGIGGLGTIVFWAGCLAGVGLGYLAFQANAAGLVWNAADRTIEIPASSDEHGVLGFLSLRRYRQLLSRQKIAVEDIRSLTDRQTTLRDSRGMSFGPTWHLVLDGPFGRQAIHFRSEERRADARALIERLRRDVPAR